MPFHDRMFKNLFSLFPDDLLRLALPRVAENRDDRPPRLLPTETPLPFPAGPGKVRIPDLVMEVGRRAPPHRILVHAEFELRRNRHVPDRMREYSHALELRHRRPVVPVVIQLSGGSEPGFRRHTRVQEIDGEVLEVFHYHELVLSQTLARDFLARPEPTAWALAALMKPGDLSPARHKLACLEKILEAENLKDTERQALVDFVETYTPLEASDAIEFERLVREKGDDMPLPNVQRSWLEQREYEGMQKGLEKGLEKGLQKGLQKGRQRGKRELLLRLMELRFGEVDGGVRKQVDRVSSAEELDRLAERVLTASSPEEMGL